MKKNMTVFLLALCPLVPAASRFAYGIVLGLSMMWLFAWGIAFREIVRKIGAGRAGPYLELVCLAASATVLTLLLQRFFPVLSVALGFYVYLSAFSSILLVSIDYFSFRKWTFLPVLPFIAELLLFSGIREIAGTGTVSFPVPSGIIEYELIPPFASRCLGFWGTSGGALILLGIFAWCAKYIHRRISSRRRNA